MTDAESREVVVLEAGSLVEGSTAKERDKFIQQAMEMTRFYLEQPDAVFDFNEHKRKNARNNWLRQKATAERRGQHIEPFDEADFPPVLHIKANTWLRLARRYDLDVAITHLGWNPDPGHENHMAYEVEAVVSKSGREVGRSRQLCSFAERQGERARWSDSAQVMATAETRARSRAISQALQWAIPFAYQTATPEEMPPIEQSQPDHDREPREAFVQTRAREQAAPPAEPPPAPTPEPEPESTQASEPVANEALDVQSQQVEEEIPYPDANDSAIQEASQNKEHHWGDNWTPVENERLGWAIRFYKQVVSMELLPKLDGEGWQAMCPILMDAAARPAEQQSELVMRLRNNPATDIENPLQMWMFSIAFEDE